VQREFCEHVGRLEHGLQYQCIVLDYLCTAKFTTLQDKAVTMIKQEGFKDTVLLWRKDSFVQM